MAKVKTLPLPGFVNLKNAAEWGYTPNNMELYGRAEEWRKQHQIKPCASDKVKVGVLLIDAQNDFCDPKGTLYVGGYNNPKAANNNGAIEDNKRVANFLYANAGVITSLTCTLDTHFPYQIFFPSFWKDEEKGQAPAPFTTITTEDIKKGKYTVNPGVVHFISKGSMPWLQAYVRHYTEALGKAGKYTLTIWPFHCLLGTPGHTLNGLIAEAALFHSWLRISPGMKEVKGGNFLTENYSVLSPEVVVDQENRAIAQKNVEFIKTLLENDHVIITGQAASHCVASSIGDLLDAINTKDPDLAKKVTILTDGTSAVTVPNGKGGYFADYTPQAEAAFKRFADAGMTLAKTTDPIESYVKGL